MNELQIFSNPEFGEIRTLDENGTVLFCASDIASALGYSNPNKAINDHCRAITKRATPISGKIQEINFIPESDLYRLVFSSKLPTAEKFTDWVTSEVLPSIRKHGAYMTPEILQAAILNPDTMIQLCQQLKAEQDKRKELESKVEADKPKVIFADAVSASKKSILVGELAKIIQQNGVNIGQNRLFKWLRLNGFLVRGNRADKNMPTQRAMQMGLFEIKETCVTHSDGHTTISKTPKVTGKGQIYFVNKFKEFAPILDETGTAQEKQH